jgi:histidine triad (HIT) family protein
VSCIFCRIAAGEIPAQVLFQDDRVVAFEDVSPQAPVHALVVPRRHVEGVWELTGEDADLIGHMVLVGRRIAEEKGLDASGYRFVLNAREGGGQSVFHLHLHVLGGRPLGWPPG